MATPQDTEWDSEITIVLIGKSGAGKSTLMNNLLGRDTIVMMSPDSTTAKFDADIVTKNRTKIRVIDTRGLAEDQSDKKKELKRLASFTEGKADILLYCVPVGPGSKFDDHNPTTMRCLTEAFGKKIWDHCALVFTMSNLALLQFQKANPDTTNEGYKNYLDQFAKQFKDQLCHRDIMVDKEVKTVFHMDLKDTSNTNTIIAVPAGWFLDDEVLPGNDSQRWIDILFAVITSKCPAKFQESILKFKYGKELAREILKGAGVGAAGGITVGAVLGSILGGVSGAVAGPPGVAIGAAIGTGVGTAAGATALGAAAGACIGKHYEDKQKKMIAKEVYDMQHKKKDKE